MPGQAVMIGQPIATTPDVPKDRVAALRLAFDQAMKDSAFNDEASKQGTEISPMSGEQTQRFILDLMATPQPIKDRVKTAFQSKAGIESSPAK